MRFALSPEQRDFAAALHDGLTEAGTAAVRAWGDGDAAPGRKLWRRLADMGVPGLLVPEEFGGTAGDAVDMVVAMEELGHHVVPGPVIESFVVVPVLLAGLDPDGAAGRWLPRLAAGDMATVALPPHVPYAADADIADPVLLVRGEQLCVVESAGLVRQPSVDPSRRLYDVCAAPATVVAAGDAVSAAVATGWQYGVLAGAAHLLGAARMLLETSTRYAVARRQFGRPIGEFQAVKHRLADVLVELEFARPLLFGAALALAQGTPTTERDVAAAGVAARRAADLAARSALQVHGAIGYTAEYDLVLWLRRVRALLSAWGTAAHHRARVAAALTQGALR